MKSIFLIAITLATLLLFTKQNSAQAPNLGRASSFAIYTATGAISNVGTTSIVGDFGTNVGAVSGGTTVYGNTYITDSVSAKAATDVDSLYNYLNRVTCDTNIGNALGGNQVLAPNVYCLGSASTLSGTLILDGQGDSNALFIFKINGALYTTKHANVILINSARVWNVFWQVYGAFELGDSSSFKGTIIADGTISLLDHATLIGRGLSLGGAIDLTNNMVELGTQQNSPLPIKLISFYTEKCDAKTCVNLNWETASELNSAYFLIERSTDGINYKTIGKLDAAGYSSQLLSYSFTDENPVHGINFYHLNQFDFDGGHEYSPVRSVTVHNTIMACNIYPNPFTTSINISIDNICQIGNCDQIAIGLRIYNALGSEVIYTSIVKPSTTLETRSIPSGIYFYEITVNSTIILSGRLVSR